MAKKKFKLEKLEDRIAPSACNPCGGGSHHSDHGSNHGSHKCGHGSHKSDHGSHKSNHGSKHCQSLGHS